MHRDVDIDIDMAIYIHIYRYISIETVFYSEILFLEKRGGVSSVEARVRQDRPSLGGRGGGAPKTSKLEASKFKCIPIHRLAQQDACASEFQASPLSTVCWRTEAVGAFIFSVSAGGEM